jgi:hypothetical protein
VLLDVEVGEQGQPEFIPANADPLETTVRPGRGVLGTVVARRGGRLTLRVSRALSSGAATLRVWITAHGRVLARGTLHGHMLRLWLRRGVRLPARFTVHGKHLRVTVRLR